MSATTTPALLVTQQQKHRNLLMSTKKLSTLNTETDSSSTTLLTLNEIKPEIIINDRQNSSSSPLLCEKDALEMVEEDESDSTTNAISLGEMMPQQQKNGEISIINVVVPIDNSESSNEENGSMTDISAIKENVEIALAQQVAAAAAGGGQVTMMQSRNAENDDTSPHYITVTVSTQDSVGGQGSYQVQYVDTDLYHNNSNQSQMTYPFCPVAEYQTNNQTFAYSTTGNYTTATNTPTSHSTGGGLPYLVPVDETLLINSSTQAQNRDNSPHNNIATEVNYIQENPSQVTAAGSTSTSTSANGSSSIGGGGGCNGSADAVGCAGGGSSSGTPSDNEQIPLVNANKIASATIKWLSRNYETADAVSLPRSTLYNHYMQHCNENKLEPVNAASFGKLIRSVFSGLRTRRLGTRGNSKYHYYGIRIRADSNLTLTMEDRQNSQNYATTAGGGHTNGVGGTSSGGGGGAGLNSVGNNNAGGGGGCGSVTASNKGRKIIPKPDTFEACAQYLGDGSGAIPPFPQIELDNTFNNELTIEDVETFRSMYREHYESFLDAVLSLEFNTIEFLWRDFWRCSDNNNLDECEEEKYLSKTKLYLLCHCEGVEKFVRQVDYQFYQNLVDVLIPDVLRSIPNVLTQAIRNFAKNLELWLCESLVGVPERIVQIKTSAVSAFCQTLRRYTSLNHLAQAARAVLQNTSQITQMLNDLNRVDFHNVQEQAAWVCQCDTTIVQRLENDFKTALSQQSTLEQWANWLRLVVDSALEEYRGKPCYAKQARQFLLKWSFYSSMVIRDLTLRSASSFGSFHLIRLLYDEYMFFLVEHKVAEAQHKTAIAVISDRMKENDYEFDYPLHEYIEENAGPTVKRMKHE